MGKALAYTLIGLVIAAALGIFVWSQPGKYDDFATCLTEKNVVMYGAFWCPHCKDQKGDFGKSFKHVTYVECADPSNPNIQTQVCKDAGITGYPTWTFPDGTQQGGKMSMESLSQKSGCPLP